MSKDQYDWAVTNKNAVDSVDRKTAERLLWLVEMDLECVEET